MGERGIARPLRANMDAVDGGCPARGGWPDATGRVCRFEVYGAPQVMENSPMPPPPGAPGKIPMRIRYVCPVTAEKVIRD